MKEILIKAFLLNSLKVKNNKSIIEVYNRLETNNFINLGEILKEL